MAESVQADQRHERLRTLQALAPSDACELERKRNVVSDSAPGKRRLFLEHHADRRMRAGYRRAGDSDVAVVVADQAADDVEQRRLAAPRRPDDRDELARVDAERDVVDRGDDVSSAGVALPRTTGTLRRRARYTARLRAEYRSPSCCLYDKSFSSSTTIRPSVGSGAKIASRVPRTN